VHAYTPKWWCEVYFYALVNGFCRAKHIFSNPCTRLLPTTINTDPTSLTTKQTFSKFHDIMVICIGHVKLYRSELRIVSSAKPLVAKNSPNLVYCTARLYAGFP
jgi:hypothetical protein